MPSIPRKHKAPWEYRKRTGFQEENRKTDERYHTHRWRKLRKLKLQANPTCEHCERENITTAANEVDHINPVKDNDEGFWEWLNLQSLCSPCHKSKSAKEKRK